MRSAHRIIYSYQPMAHDSSSTTRAIIGGVIVVLLLACIAACAIGWALATKRAASAEGALAAYREQAGSAPPPDQL